LELEAAGSAGAFASLSQQQGAPMRAGRARAGAGEPAATASRAPTFSALSGSGDWLFAALREQRSRTCPRPIALSPAGAQAPSVPLTA